MEEKLEQIILDLRIGFITFEVAKRKIFNLFSNGNRYSLSYLDVEGFEQKTEVWAKDQEDALKQLEKNYPNATHIFISRM